jgi:hypothetical protein
VVHDPITHYAVAQARKLGTHVLSSCESPATEDCLRGRMVFSNACHWPGPQPHLQKVLKYGMAVDYQLCILRSVCRMNTAHRTCAIEKNWPSEEL